MLFPRALSLSHRAELSAAPPLPVRSCLFLLCLSFEKAVYADKSIAVLCLSKMKAWIPEELAVRMYIWSWTYENFLTPSQEDFRTLVQICDSKSL